jgi:hypothetical protein
MSVCPICTSEFQPKRRGQVFCSVTCRQKNNGTGRRGQRTGLRSTPYKTRLTKDGYLRMYAAKHPFAASRKEMHVHDMVMELHLGRRLRPEECVHHLNGCKTDNRLENLQVMLHADHSSEHMTEIVRTKRRRSGRFA